MPRDVTQPTQGRHDDEQVHPSWGIIGASRVSTSPPGSALFDSDIQHQHSVVVRLGRASRYRNLNRDWIRKDYEIIEVEMSEAQWASFVSSMNAGEGVPCTIRTQRDEEGRLETVPGAPYEPRLQESMREVREEGERLIAKLHEAFAAVEAKPTKANIRTLKFAIENIPANVEYVARSLGEHAENVVQRAKADIEAMVIKQAQHLGLEPGDLGVTPPQLEAGPDA